MKYRVLLPSPKNGSRLTETVGVNAKQMVFNRAILAKLKISSVGESYIGLAVNDDGLLCLTVLKDNAARTAFRPTKPKSTNGTRFIGPGKQILNRLPKGRFAITGQDGGWWITDCRYDDSGEAPIAPEETAPAAKKSAGTRTPPDGWPGGGLEDAECKTIGTGVAPEQIYDRTGK